MSDFGRLITEDRRLSILLLLDDAVAANEALLQTALAQFGHSPSADQVAGDLAWLAEQGLATTSKLAGLVVARITTRGSDVANGRAVVPGVKRPRP